MFHPNPEFLFAAAAGPLFDIGSVLPPHSWCTSLGPFASVSAVVGRGNRETRTIQVGDRAGTEFPVTAYTHVRMVANFAGGAVSQSMFSFDSPLSRIMFRGHRHGRHLVHPRPEHADGTCTDHAPGDHGHHARRARVDLRTGC